MKAQLTSHQLLSALCLARDAPGRRGESSALACDLAQVFARIRCQFCGANALIGRLD